jgi:uncharacterized protein YkwD
LRGLLLAVLSACASLGWGCIGTFEMVDDDTTTPSAEDPCAEISLNTEERVLVALIQDYRAERDLPPVPVSRSLSRVARSHVRDLDENAPDFGECNAHSWSDQGDWTPCCYTPDHAAAQCMWDKPDEIADFSAYGYEIAFGSSSINQTGYQATARDAFDGWRGSPGHNAVMVNLEPWDRYEWRALGVAVHAGFAVAWFASADDPWGTLDDCLP